MWLSKSVTRNLLYIAMMLREARNIVPEITMRIGLNRRAQKRFFTPLPLIMLRGVLRLNKKKDIFSYKKAPPPPSNRDEAYSQRRIT
jgi:hypothetical protein